MKTIESLQDLIEEAKLRTVWWILCIFAVSYFLTHTSKSMLMNAPIAILFVAGLRVLLNEVDFQWKVRENRPKSYLSHLEKKQLAVNDSRLTTPPPPKKWRRKIDSPIVEEAIEDFINKILHDFVIDLWYSVITPDKEAPELMHSIIMDAIGEVCGRIKEINLVDLLTRDVVDLIGDHLDLFRRNQAAIGVDVMVTLSSEERDERLKHHLLASKELHPALISPECEYKVLQRLMGGILAVVLRPREAQSPLVRCMAREFLTCLVIQPVMNFASPMYVNELIEYMVIAYNSEGYKKAASRQSPNVDDYDHERTVFVEKGLDIESSLKKSSPSGDYGELYVIQTAGGSGDIISSAVQGESIQARHADWARAFDAATQRRTEVLMPENLENMWAIGRNYKKKLQKKAGSGLQAPDITGTNSVSSTVNEKKFASELPKQKPEIIIKTDDKICMQLPPRPQVDYPQNVPSIGASSQSQELNKVVFTKGNSSVHQLQNTASLASTKNLKRSSSTPDLNVLSNMDGDTFDDKSSMPIIDEYYISNTRKKNMKAPVSSSEKVVLSAQENIQKLRSRVVGAYFERLGSKSFAVYNILVIDADNNTWCVKRRYRNFERLHRHLKDIPNYTLHLPPKRFFSSSTEDAFVHQRCIQLDKYLQELLSIANVAEQHEVWDFLSASSKNYSFGKSASVMKTFAGNVDDAVDDILRQFKGVSDGLISKTPGLPSWSLEQDGSVMHQNFSGYTDDISKLTARQSITDSMNSFSDNDDDDKDGNQGENKLEGVGLAAGSLSDYDSNSKQFQQKIVNYNGQIGHLNLQDIQDSRLKSDASFMNRPPEPSLTLTSVPQEDPAGVPPEWTPPNLSVPVLNLVDNIFQLNRRGWLRRQVFWISKQILQLIMEDAIDDWLLMQIQLLRREDVIAQGIRWVRDVLWPDGTFFLKLRPRGPQSEFEATVEPEQTARQSGGVRATPLGSFEQHLEAARRASDVKKMIFNGAPSPLVSLIGHKQYRHCARDIYYFLQSTVCLKQLGYGILETVLISIFPELRDVVKDIHEKMANQSV